MYLTTQFKDASVTQKDSYQFHVTLSKDQETGQTVAQVPSLYIADYGVDRQETFSKLQNTLVFHLGYLKEKGKPIPQ